MREIDLPDSIQDFPLSQGLIHQVVVSMQANRRQGTASTKTRAEVRGGGRKPWRQKGTGRARHGSIRSPLWRGGGTIFGPQPNRHWQQVLNRKMKRRAVAMILADKIRHQRLVCVERVALPEAKTKLAVQAVETWREHIPALGGTAMTKRRGLVSYLLLASVQPDTVLAWRNIPGWKIEEARNMNALDLVGYPYTIIEADAIREVTRYFK